jgi:hypothetical protein
MDLGAHLPLVDFGDGIASAAGFQLVSEEPHHSYGVDLVGQTYALSL